ncbi:MAG TPA: peptidylprolyl isomerase [Sphingomicrobium sp.]|nr:peptidylprolyl isomerase [Sphingomicrobium sp.]
MLSFFRRLSKSKIGTGIMAAVLIAILGGFALADLSNFGTGSLGFGLGSSTLAEAGGHEISDRDMRDAMQRRLAQAREQNPNADYPTIIGDFDPLLAQMIDQRAITAFADKYGFVISKRLIDAEIAGLPGVRGLNGQPSVQGYQAFLAQQRMTDSQVRQSITTELVAKYLLLPISAEARVPVGVATPYASMLLEERDGEAAVVPFTAFTAGLKPTDADLQNYLTANRNRYMVPEQRVVRFAMIGPDQVAGIAATDQEAAAYYKANQASYAAKETRVLTQAVVPEQATAAAIAAKARGGTALAAAAGSNAAVTTLDPQTRDAYASVAGAKAAAAAFSAASGAVVGPVQSEFGWVVVKVDSVKTTGGKSFDAAKAEIAAKLTGDKRKQAIEDIVDKVQDALDNGSNFAEAAAQAKLPVTTTPLVEVSGRSRADPNYRLPANLAGALKAAFEIAANDPPELPALADKSGYVMVAPAEIVAAAPAPLASIRDRVLADWTVGQGMARARAAAAAIAAKASGGMSLADAVKQSGADLPVRPLQARRLQVAQANADVMPALRTLFSLTAGKAKMVPDTQGRGFFVVKVNTIKPGNALLQAALIAQMRKELQQATADDYARQFVAAIREDVKVRRNDKAIDSVKRQITSGGS